jgi:hypothetical protein
VDGTEPISFGHLFILLAKPSRRGGGRPYLSSHYGALAMRKGQGGGQGLVSAAPVATATTFSESEPHGEVQLRTRGVIALARTR